VTAADRRTLGIIAGGGEVPLIVAAAAQAEGREVMILGIAGEADPAIARHRHEIVRWGEIGRMFDLLRRAGVGDIVVCGAITRRPDFKSIRLDLGAIMSLPRILGIVVGGDDTVLTGVIRFVEDKGFRIVGAHEIAPALVAPAGSIGRIAPPRGHAADAEAGYVAAVTLGRLDIGQAAVAIGGRVVGVEGVEGTDGLLKRVAELRAAGRLSWKGRSGVLVKAAKPQQDLRVDMPTIGPHTAEIARDAGLAGIAVEAGRVMIVGRAETEAVLDAAGMYLVGLPQHPVA
jgi:DUF1009 family protein